MVGAATPFEEFWQIYVLSYGAPVLQMLLWIVQIAVLIYAVILFKRFVDFKTGRTQTAAADEADKKVDVEEFVE